MRRFWRIDFLGTACLPTAATAAATEAATATATATAISFAGIGTSKRWGWWCLGPILV